MANVLRSHMPSPVDNTILIAHVNGMRTAAVMHEVRKGEKELQLDLVCFQESYTRHGNLLGMQVSAQIASLGVNPTPIV